MIYACWTETEERENLCEVFCRSRVDPVSSLGWVEGSYEVYEGLQTAQAVHWIVINPALFHSEGPENAAL